MWNSPYNQSHRVSLILCPCRVGMVGSPWPQLSERVIAPAYRVADLQASFKETIQTLALVTTGWASLCRDRGRRASRRKRSLLACGQCAKWSDLMKCRDTLSRKRCDIPTSRDQSCSSSDLAI